MKIIESEDGQVRRANVVVVSNSRLNIIRRLVGNVQIEIVREEEVDLVKVALTWLFYCLLFVVSFGAGMLLIDQVAVCVQVIGYSVLCHVVNISLKRDEHNLQSSAEYRLFIHVNHYEELYTIVYTVNSRYLQL